jgi:hypothetical protein
MAMLFIGMAQRVRAIPCKLDRETTVFAISVD